MHAVSTGSLLRRFANGEMYAVPKILHENNKIIIKGKMVAGTLDIALRPSDTQKNIVCQVTVDCVGTELSENDRITISNVLMGKPTIFSDSNLAAAYFCDSRFDVRFTLLPGAIIIAAGETPIEAIPLQHSLADIKFVSVMGNVEEMTFKFK